MRDIDRINKNDNSDECNKLESLDVLIRFLGTVRRVMIVDNSANSENDTTLKHSFLNALFWQLKVAVVIVVTDGKASMC